MKTGSVHYSVSSQNGLRFDASFHLSEGLVVKRKIASSPYEMLKIKDVASDIFYGNRAKRVYVSKKDHGIPFLSSSDILQADLDNVKLASKKYTPCIEQMMLKKGWILISRSGTIGNCAFANAKHAQKLASEHVIRLVPNNILRGGLVYAYLASKYGYSLLTQGTFGAVIQHIEPNFVASLPIPNFPDAFQNDVDNLIQESAKLREEAGDCLHEAETIMNNFIPLKFEKTGFKTKSVSYSNIKDSLQLRIDPPALINNGVEVMDRLLSSMESKKIGDLNVKVYRPGIFKRVYVENGFPYIKGGEVFFTNPFRRCVYVSRTKTPFVDEMKLKEGQILIMCAGTVSVGKVKLITKEYEDKNCIGSQDIIRLESEDDLFTKEYLFMYLQLPFVYDYIISMKYGSVIERIEPFHIESIPVITPSNEISKKITSIIKRYMDLSYKAFNAEEKAIKMVEEEIEKWNN